MGFIQDVALKFPAIRRLHDSRNALLAERGALAEQLAASEARRSGRASTAASPFFHYNASFDPQEVMRRHAVPDVKARPGYLTNFLGVAIDPKFFPTILDGRAGQVEGIPIPANWHADIAEWGAALRAVDLAHDSFTMVELGCGWACWMNNTGVAARRTALDVHLIGIEGDEGHIVFAREACEANGFRADQVTLRHGIAAAGSGFALFPRQERAGIGWGSEPIFNASQAQRRNALASGSHDELPMISLAEIAAPHTRIDLLHVDIQGGEADLIADCLQVLRQKVAYIVIGTHSRQIEGRLFEALLQAGWQLEIERPAILSVAHSAPSVTVDGIQGWRNPDLAPDQQG